MSLGHVHSSGPFYTSNQTASVAKLNQVFEKCVKELEQILDGYCLPEPYFTPKLQKTVNQFMACLRDPRLPLIDIQVGDSLLEFLLMDRSSG